MRLVVRDLTPGQAYALQFRSNTGTEVSEWSQILRLETSADTIAPAAITGLTWVVSGTSFVAKWNDATEADFKDYEVTVRNGQTYETFYVTEPRFDFPIELNTGVFGTPKATVTVEVRARDLGLNIQPVSVTATATNPSPAAPTNFAAQPVVNGINFTWTKVADTDLKTYRLYKGSTPGTVTTLIWEGLSTNFTYSSTNFQTNEHFKVAAVDVFGSETFAANIPNAAPLSFDSADVTPPANPTWVTDGTWFTAETDLSNRHAIRSNVTLKWNANAEDDLRAYIVRYKKTTDSQWTYVNIVGSALVKPATTVKINGLAHNTAYNFELAAQDKTMNLSGYVAAPGSGTTPTDSTAPSVPSQPVVTAWLGTLVIKWDGKANGGGAMASDTSYVDVHVSTTNNFTPSDATLKARINNAFSGKPQDAVVAGLTYGTTYYVKLVAVDFTGNTSAASAQATGVPRSVTGADVESLTLDPQTTWTDDFTIGDTDWIRLVNGHVPTVRNNLCANPNFESGWTGYTEYKSGTYTISYNSSITSAAGGMAPARANTAVYRIDLSSLGTTTNDRVGANYYLPAEEGAQYVVSAHFRVNSGSTTHKMGIYTEFRTDTAAIGGSVTTTEILTDTTPGTWNRISTITPTAPAGTTQMRFILWVRGSGTSTAGAIQVDIDGVMVEQSTVLGSYFDGSTPVGLDGSHSYWEGTANNSVSAQYVPVEGTPTVNLITNPSFETGVTGWFIANSTLTKYTPSASFNGRGPNAGTYMGRAAFGTGGTASYIATPSTTELRAAPGEWIGFSANVWADSTRSVSLRILPYDAAGVSIGNGAFSPLHTNNSVYQTSRLSVAMQMPANTAYVRFLMYGYEAGSTTNTSVVTPFNAYIDECLAVRGVSQAHVNAQLARGFFDGSTPNGRDKRYVWLGPAHDSPSASSYGPVETSVASAIAVTGNPDNHTTAIRTNTASLWITPDIAPFPYDPNVIYRLSGWFRRMTGAGKVFLGWIGYAEDGTTWVNYRADEIDNGGVLTSFHYHAASGAEPALTTWVKYTGHSYGSTYPLGSTNAAPNQQLPGVFHGAVKYIKPVVIMNYTTAGQTDFAGIKVETIPFQAGIIGRASIMDASIDSAKIASLEAGKITTGEISVNQRISAGPLNGTHAEMTHTGFRVYAEDTTDGIPNEVVRLGTDTNDYFAVTGTEGQILASIDDTGRASFTNMNLDNWPVIGGTSLKTMWDEEFNKRGRGLIAWADHGININNITSEYGISEFQFYVPDKRALSVKISDFSFSTGSVDGMVLFRLRYTNDGSQPSITSPYWGGYNFQNRIGGGSGFIQAPYEFFGHPARPEGGIVRLLLTANVYGSTHVHVQGNVRWVVEDIGPFFLANGTVRDNNGGGSIYVPPPRYQRYWEQADQWRQTYRGNGTVRTDTTDVVQGYSSYSASNGDQKGYFGWNTDTGSWAGATMDQFHIYMYSNHWHYNSGGTARIGYHGHGGPPGAWTGSNARFDWGGWPKPGGQTGGFNGWLGAMQNGSMRGVALGPGDGTDPTYYGRFSAGNTIGKVWYTK